VARIRIDVDELSASARLLEEGDDETLSQGSASSGRSQLDKAMSALDAAWAAAPGADDARLLASRLRGARQDAIAVESMIVEVVRATGDGVWA